VVFLDLEFWRGLCIDLERLEKLITPKTRLVSLTTPHNPSGTMINEAELRQVLRIIESGDCCYLLCDETYREMSFSPSLPIATSLSERAISVSSLSKTSGLPAAFGSAGCVRGIASFRICSLSPRNGSWSVTPWSMRRSDSGF
jgi:aspartate/methionine/tyrosine aminotransferase